MRHRGRASSEAGCARHSLRGAAGRLRCRRSSEPSAHPWRLSTPLGAILPASLEAVPAITISRGTGSPARNLHRRHLVMNTVATRTARWTPINVAAVVLGFAAWWPLGIAAIAYVLWGGSIDELIRNGFSQLKGVTFPQRSSGNAAFDAYRAATLERLSREQAEFNAFVRRLREARDQEEFDRFMKERKDI